MRFYSEMNFILGINMMDFLSCFQNLMASIYIFIQNTTCWNVQTKTNSKLTEYFLQRKVTPTTPVAAPIKKTRKFQELWKERLNFRIPGHLICVFKCCYRSPTVVIINIISVYKNHEYTSFFHPLRDCGPRYHLSLEFNSYLIHWLRDCGPW